MPKFRDSQKSKVYSWQKENFPQELSRAPGLTEGQMRTVLGSCLRRFGVQDYAPAHGYSIQQFKIKKPKYLPCLFTFEIPYQYSSPFIMVHEAAHAVVQLLKVRCPELENEVSHGPLFVSVFSDLLISVLGYPAGDVLNSLHDSGVRAFNFVKFKALCPRYPVEVLGTDISKIQEAV